MPSTYSPNLAIELIGTGDQAGSWGSSTNTNLGTLIEQAISGYVTQTITDGADTPITIPPGATGVARNIFIECTGTLTAARNLVVPANRKLYYIFNNTVGGFAVTVKVSGLTGISVPNGKKMVLVSNGTDIFVATNHLVGTLVGNVDGVVTAAAGSTAVTPAPGDNDTSIATTAFVTAALQAVYPVGSIYINAGVSTNPATLLGFGTWAAFGAGRVMVGLNAGDVSFDTLEETGGSKDAIVVSHNHTGTTTSAGLHNHFAVYNGNTDLPSQLTPTVYSNATIAAVGSSGFEAYVLNGSAGNAADGGATSQAGTHDHTFTTSTAGSSGTNANLQPYITVAMWKRTA
jgi:hypothetical protein